jgi:enoyl-CoA hydratase/carnithine racemase
LARRWRPSTSYATLRMTLNNEDQMTQTILYSRIEHVGYLTLNNPQRHNSLGREQLEGIHERLDQIAADPEVRVLVVTGAGEKTFCAGAALHELSDGQIDDDAFQKMTGQLADLPIPTICAMNGNVFGGGAELAVSCDFRIGIEGCRMRVPAAAIGLCYPLSGITRFIECLGVSVTKRILVASEELDADTLLGIGFLNHLVSPQDLDSFVREYAQHIADLAPLSVQSMKRILRQAAAGVVDPAQVKALTTMCLESNDLQEGFSAKREKRKPRFEGR